MKKEEDYDNFFYENQEIVLETPQKKFKGYIAKLDENILNIILYACFEDKKVLEFDLNDCNPEKDIELIKKTDDINIINYGFSKTYKYKIAIHKIFRNTSGIFIKANISGKPIEEREGREFVRVIAVIQFIYQKISMEEFLETKESYIARPSFTTSVYGIYGVASPKVYGTHAEKDEDIPINPKLENLLIAINSKLDVILSILNPEASIFSDVKEKRVSISGSGIMWIEETDKNDTIQNKNKDENKEDLNLKLGDILKITMLFPSVPQFVVKALAQVVNVSEYPSDEGSNKAKISFACKFTAINESDRDEIIKFTFEQQRRQIAKQNREQL
ncbi:MAG: hypothetical protein EVJ48_05160 [Candidatus Acidulodesulfobacterium acidiphilum]|uniref:PilZ domain-containing protein n=1 Tax=Candidatus Acidulodesulfobacterium acidiphilum TaxID=2597224 RepID=A0A520XDN1_9DELT|nr:MAG: hypothetical protein EVJ48_05160 [Candidatus Acidulodesulfobacterium acidiphilum]